MDLKLKSLSKEAIPAALDKARQYRLLNEPVEAESICLDILEAEPDNQQALIVMLLALTDQFRLELALQSLARPCHSLRIAPCTDLVGTL